MTTKLKYSDLPPFRWYPVEAVKFDTECFVVCWTGEPQSKSIWWRAVVSRSDVSWVMRLQKPDEQQQKCNTTEGSGITNRESNEPMNESCKTCRFWKCVPRVGALNNKLTDRYGECRISRPKMGGICDDKWPSTTDSDWCGEYQAAEPTPPQKPAMPPEPPKPQPVRN